MGSKNVNLQFLCPHRSSGVQGLSTDSQAAFVSYLQIRAKSNFIVDYVSFYSTEVRFACCQDCIIPFHTLKWEIQDTRRGNHEKLQMLVSLQPTKIKTRMICAFVCFLTQGILFQHYVVRKKLYLVIQILNGQQKREFAIYMSA